MKALGRRRPDQRSLFFRRHRKNCGDGNDSTNEVPTLIEVSSSTLETRDDDEPRRQKEGHEEHRIMPSSRDEAEEENNVDKDLRGKKQRKKWCWLRSNGTAVAVGGSSKSRPGLRPQQIGVRTTATAATTATTYEGNETLFWSSPTAWSIYGLLVLYVLSGGHSIFFYALGYLLLNLYGRIAAKWIQYIYDSDPELWRSIRYLRKSYRKFWQETDRIVSGDYGRQVVAAYLIHAATAPGESYLAFLIRHKMSILHYQWIDELNRFGERRLGYEPSKRDVFA
jgi:hypothetical protein